jgi:hypothetical protein
MVSPNRELLYASASEEDFNHLLGGSLTPVVKRWDPAGRRLATSAELGVILAWDGTTAKPLAVVAQDDALRRLYGRLSHVRNEFSPLSVWAHVLTPRFEEAIKDSSREAQLSNLEAAWSGLAVAEAQILSGNPIGAIRVQACLATQSFAVGRSIALWPHISAETAAEAYDETRRILRNNGAQRGIDGLKRLWLVLASLSAGRDRKVDPTHRSWVDI